MDNQFHIDNETLDTTDSAQLLSIGACFGSHAFYREIDITEYEGKPFTVSESTMQWWQKQGGFRQSIQLTAPGDAVAELFEWVRDLSDKDSEFWANSPTFDLKQLEYHARYFHLQVPWAFYQEADVRTVKRVSRRLGLRAQMAPNPHNALQDAVNQRNFVGAVHQELGHMKSVVRRLALNHPEIMESINEEIRMELLSSERFRELPTPVLPNAGEEGHKPATIRGDDRREPAAQNVGAQSERRKEAAVGHDSAGATLRKNPERAER